MSIQNVYTFVYKYIYLLLKMNVYFVFSTTSQGL